jgi:mannosyltransferase
VSTAATDAAFPGARLRTSWLPLAALLLLGGVLRFATLGTQSLWFDEAATWELTRLPFGDMLSALPHRESNPPLFYVLEWLTTRALGDSEAALRMVSALAGTALIVIGHAIGRRVGGSRVALATAALLAVNPLLVWFSQEARSYELVALLSAASLLLFLRALDDDRPRLLAWWALLSALALCTHYFACFVLAPQIAWLLWRHPRRRAVWGATAALALVAAALLPLLLEQRGNPYDIAGESVALRLLQIPKQFLLGYRGPLALPIGLLGGALIVAGVWLLLTRAEHTARDRALLVGAIGLGGIALPLAGAVLGADYLNGRNLIPALVPLATALAAGFAVSALRLPTLGPILLGALCTVSLSVVVAVAADPQYQRDDWKGLAHALGRSDERRVLVISPANGGAVLRYYRPGLRPLADAGVPARAIDVVGVAVADRPGQTHRLPTQVGTQFPFGAFVPPQETRGGRWVILRYRQPDMGLVQPGPAASIRFSQLPPNVSVLPAGK